MKEAVGIKMDHLFFEWGHRWGRLPLVYVGMTCFLSCWGWFGSSSWSSFLGPHRDRKC